MSTEDSPVTDSPVTDSPVTDSPKRDGVGTILARILSFGYLQLGSNCAACKDLAAVMDSEGPDKVLTDIKMYAQKVSTNITAWRQGIRMLVPPPPLSIIERLIRYACEKASKD